MTPDQRRRVRDVFEAALDRDAASQEVWIAQEAADDTEVRDEVLSLLEHNSRAGAFLSAPILERAPDALAEDEPMAAGTVIGAYTIVRELGRGGMGRVYLASDARLGRTVALKALAPHLTRDPRQRDRLRREARAAAALTHAGICTVYALEEIDGEVYIATEFVDGHTLREEMAGPRPLPAEEVLRTARHLAEALAGAHAHQVVHRDLKPENVMRTADGRVKILDFGLAMTGAAPQDPSVTLTGAVVGTPAYMAPEQRQPGPVDARADVFAYGVLLYEYACGEHPLRAATPLDVPEPLASVIARCLREAPAERYASAAEIVAALGAPPAREADRGGVTRWSAHQIVIAVLYILAAALAWLNKERIEVPLTVSIFLALGAIATVGGVLRGHLVFTAQMNRAHLAAERRRVARPIWWIDLGAGTLLLIDAVLMAGTSALSAVFTISLALGIVLATLVLEPATETAAFGGGTEN
jgi:serine/threonine-protein kinase